MTTAAQLVAEVKSSGVEQTKSDLKSVGKAADDTSSGFKSALGSAMGFISAQAVMNVVGGAVNFLKGQVVSLFQESMDAQAGMAQTVSVLKSTNDASGMTAQSIADLAGQMSHLTLFSDDTTQAAENMLLTFTNIGQSVFPDATKTVLDMSQALGTDTKSSAIELGKALNDPITGISALQRVGVTFTDSQKNLIKSLVDTGDTAGAQKVILQELQREFGGSAEAAGKTFPGQLQILGQSMDDIKQKMGDALMPIMQQFTGYISSTIMPIVNNFSDWFTSTAVPAIQRFAGYLQSTVIPAVQHFASWMITMAQNSQVAVPALIALSGVIAAIVVPAFLAWAAALDVNPISWIILGIAAAVAGLTAAFMALYNNNAGFRGFIQGLGHDFQQIGSFIQANFLPAMQRLGTAILPVLQQIGSFLASTFMPVWQQLQQLWQQQLLPLFQQLWNALQLLLPIFQVIGAIIGGVVVVAIGLLVGVLKGAVESIAGFLSGIVTIIGGIVSLVTGAVQVFSGILRFIFDLITGNWSKLGNDLGTIGQGIVNIFSGMWRIIQGVFQAAWGAISGMVGGFVSGVVGFFQSLFDKLVGHSIVPDMINGIISFFASLPGKALTFVEQLATGAIGKFNDFKTMAVNIFHDIVDGIGNAFSSLGSAIWGPIKGALNSAIDLINSFINGLDDLHVSLPGGGSLGFSIPDIPHLALGGLIGAAGIAEVGERGRELVYLPQGAQVIPNNQINNFMSGGQQQQQASPQPIILQVDGHTFAQIFMPYIVGQIRNQVGIWGM